MDYMPALCTHWREPSTDPYTRGLDIPKALNSNYQYHQDMRACPIAGPRPQWATLQPLDDDDSGRVRHSRRRIPVACARCRKRKIKCSGDVEGNGRGCSNCNSAGIGHECHFARVRSETIDWESARAATLSTVPHATTTGMVPLTQSSSYAAGAGSATPFATTYGDARSIYSQDGQVRVSGTGTKNFISFGDYAPAVSESHPHLATCLSETPQVSSTFYDFQSGNTAPNSAVTYVNPSFNRTSDPSTESYSAFGMHALSNSLPAHTSYAQPELHTERALPPVTVPSTARVAASLEYASPAMASSWNSASSYAAIPSHQPPPPLVGVPSRRGSAASSGAETLIDYSDPGIKRSMAPPPNLQSQSCHLQRTNSTSHNEDEYRTETWNTTQQLDPLDSVLPRRQSTTSATHMGISNTGRRRPRSFDQCDAVAASMATGGLGDGMYAPQQVPQFFEQSYRPGTSAETMRHLRAQGKNRRSSQDSTGSVSGAANHDCARSGLEPNLSSKAATKY